MFSWLDRASVPKGKGAIICMKQDLSAIDKDNYIMEYDLKKRKIILNLHIDEKISTMYDYFDIFLGRMTMCSKAARVLDAKFSLIVNEQRVL